MHQSESHRPRTGCMPLLQRLQVESYGSYSRDQWLAYQEYRTRTSWSRALTVCLLTPLPCIALMVAVDVIPLEPVEWGALRSPHVWLRYFNSCIIIVGTLVTLLRHQVHTLQLTTWRVVLIVLVASAVATLSCVFLASVVIGFPLPFTMVLGSMPGLLTYAFLVYVMGGRAIVGDLPTRRMLRHHLKVMVWQFLMTVSYPLFNAAFSTLGANGYSQAQTAIVLVLPVLKVFFKLGIGRTLTRTPADRGNLETIVFNVEVFHALFVTLCMQSATTVTAIALLLAADLAEVAFSVREIWSLVGGMSVISVAVASTTSEDEDLAGTRKPSGRMLTSPRAELAENAREDGIFKTIQPLRCQRKPRVTPVIVSVRSVKVAPGPTSMETTTTLSPATPASKRGVLSQADASNERQMGVILKLLYICEFLALVEYTEVIIPFIYNAFLLVLFQLPNHEFYPFLHDLSTPQLLQIISNISLYASLEFISLILTAFFAWIKLQHSLLHQLAFVLETRQASIQAKIILWSVYICQTTVIQLGADYTFQFKWLREPSVVAITP